MSERKRRRDLEGVRGPGEPAGASQRRFYEWASLIARQAADKPCKAVYPKPGAEAWEHWLLHLLSGLREKFGTRIWLRPDAFSTVSAPLPAMPSVIRKRIVRFCAGILAGQIRAGQRSSSLRGKTRLARVLNRRTDT